MGAPGGGLCQLANLLYWMALHLELEVLERHHHAVDLFPDDDRVVPFGMGATVFYNYLDLRFRNQLEQAILLRVEVDPPRLRGSAYSERPLPFQVRVFETSHRLVSDPEGVIWRENRVTKEIRWADGTPARLTEVAHNRGRVCYRLPDLEAETMVSAE